MERVIEQEGMDLWNPTSGLLAQIENGLVRVFGCWHIELSLPFTRGRETYRTCVACGARRRFDLEQWLMTGEFYYPQL